MAARTSLNVMLYANLPVLFLKQKINFRNTYCCYQRMSEILGLTLAQKIAYVSFQVSVMIIRFQPKLE